LLTGQGPPDSGPKRVTLTMRLAYLIKIIFKTACLNPPCKPAPCAGRIVRITNVKYGWVEVR
jgi:hypothetical protein